MDKNAESVLNWLEKDVAPTSVGFSFTVHITARFEESVDIKRAKLRQIQNEFLQFIREACTTRIQTRHHAEDFSAKLDRVTPTKLVAYDLTAFCNFPEEDK
jgi:hypothetical protein